MSELRRKNVRTAVVFFTVAAGMLGLAYASVPLYRLFCQVTGLGGTPGIQAKAPDTASDVDFQVRFDSNINPKLQWTFQPVQREMTVKLGEERLAFFEATNTSDETLTGTATFNVTPLKVGQYFVKIDCFCFTEQTLKPGETVQMPVSFFVDPAIYEDKGTQDVTTITLSYTFFPKEESEKGKVSALPVTLSKPNIGG